MRNSTMFWRIVRRLLTSNYSRLFVILLALGAGAAITAALLNLQIDARRRLTTEFRSLGANVLVVPRAADQMPGSNGTARLTIDESVLSKVPSHFEGKAVPAVAFLYVIGEAAKSEDRRFTPVVLSGTRGAPLADVIPKAPKESLDSASSPTCIAGAKAASQLHARPGDELVLRDQGREASCKISEVLLTGGPEDSQIFASLASVQSLSNLPGQISLIQMSATGTPDAIRQFIAQLSARLPGVDVRGVKQLAVAEDKLYNRISGLLTATVILVLLLTSLCVMAGMSNVAIERKNDVGLMKAIGGSVRRVVRLFLVEAILMGIAAGVVGSAAGLLGSIWLGKAVFGVAAQPRWIVYPVSVALTILVAIASAYPLRRLAQIRPASVFRGEA